MLCRWIYGTPASHHNAARRSPVAQAAGVILTICSSRGVSRPGGPPQPPPPPSPGRARPSDCRTPLPRWTAPHCTSTGSHLLEHQPPGAPPEGPGTCLVDGGGEQHTGCSSRHRRTPGHLARHRGRVPGYPVRWRTARRLSPSCTGPPVGLRRNSWAIPRARSGIIDQLLGRMAVQTAGAPRAARSQASPEAPTRWSEFPARGDARGGRGRTVEPDGPGLWRRRGPGAPLRKAGPRVS
jgi:hypothetical protein